MITLTSVRERIQRGAKNVFNDIGFALDADGSYGNSRSGRRYNIPGTSLNWDSMTGDLWDCPTVQACLNWITRNFIQAPPQVVRKNDEGEDTPRANHPLTELLLNPNELYDYSTLMSGTLLSWFLNGNAYWLIERGSYQQPVELWWLPHNSIKPKRRQGSKRITPDYYELRSGGKTEQIKRSDIVHFRYGIDPYNYLMGMSPLCSISRDVYTLQQAITYTARMMKNSGVIGALATAEDPQYVFDTEDFVARYQNIVTGDRQGEVLAVDGPIKLQFPNFTPQNMALETLPDRSEANICAVFGIAAQLIGIHSGRFSKTYANMGEAKESGWEECIIPNQIIIGSQGGRQLLPQLSGRSRTERLTFDISKIRPLQPDLDALFARADNSWKLGLIDRSQWKVMVGMKPAPDDEGLFYYDLFPAISGEIPPGAPMPAAGAPSAQNGAQAARDRSERNGSERAIAA